ncbi:zinc-dependent peptidase [Methylomonas sp. LL1]|uniref:M90 family metallopeptidase n=1 Tax=Methylomonas sp. LL1 TaxID=2785785 RepID=UPI0018C35C66|nr:M90 family metallopeptidase [Methylomonas sp. LL1]QPK63993.1 zinc-dependent peptidase [Methylomonas sp. LL1]
MNILKRARIRYILHRHAIAHGLWLEIVDHLSLLQGLTAVEKAHLRELTTLFLYEKNFIGAQGFQLTDYMRVGIAVQTCLCILEIGLSCLSGWTDVIVYRGPFRVSRDTADAVGVVHHQDHVLSGESWSRGPIVLSWADVEQDMQQSPRNVVIHEIAHKLDALNGTTNGYPPLHYGMSVSEWTEVMSQAYEALNHSLEYQYNSGLDPYAAHSPAEFFAVVSEVFFCHPERLDSQFPEVYRQLQLYYRQDPKRRLHAASRMI